MSKLELDPDMLVAVVLGDLFLVENHGLNVRPSYSRISLFSDEWLLELEVEIKAQGFQVREMLDLTGISKEETKRTAYQQYIRMAQKLSYRLFEKDPRIGLYRTPNFPYSPLFDPPYLDQPYTVLLSEHLHQRPTYRGPAENRPPADILQRCPLCNCFTSNFSSNFGEINTDVGVWGGANLGFVHPRCVPWITPRLT